MEGERANVEASRVVLASIWRHKSATRHQAIWRRRNHRIVAAALAPCGDKSEMRALEIGERGGKMMLSGARRKWAARRCSSGSKSRGVAEISWHAQRRAFPRNGASPALSSLCAVFSERHASMHNRRAHCAARAKHIAARALHLRSRLAQPPSARRVRRGKAPQSASKSARASSSAQHRAARSRAGALPPACRQVMLAETALRSSQHISAAARHSRAGAAAAPAPRRRITLARSKETVGVALAA